MRKTFHFIPFIIKSNYRVINFDWSRHSCNILAKIEVNLLVSMLKIQLRLGANGFLTDLSHISWLMRLLQPGTARINIFLNLSGGTWGNGKKTFFIDFLLEKVSYSPFLWYWLILCHFLGFHWENFANFLIFWSNLSIFGEICQFLAPQHIEDKLKKSKRRKLYKVIS